MSPQRLASLVTILAAIASPAWGEERDLYAVATALRPGQSSWQDASVAATAADVPVTLVVSLALQRLYVYRQGALVAVARVSSGKPGKTTPTGDFPILEKARWHRSNLYSDASMPFMQRLTWDGVALHAGHDPGVPASHGCVRLPEGFARALFAVTSIGDVVTVTDYPPVTLDLDPTVIAPGLAQPIARLDYSL